MSQKRMAVLVVLALAVGAVSGWLARGDEAAKVTVVEGIGTMSSDGQQIAFKVAGAESKGYSLIPGWYDANGTGSNRPCLPSLVSTKVRIGLIDADLRKSFRPVVLWVECLREGQGG